MSGYRRVNYYELCRLCVSSEGTKMHIFREEGRRRQLPSKIQMCLPLQVQEDDSLPKIICNQCVEKLEIFFDFRKSCVNAEAMLESYFTSSRYSPEFIREGKVYVKDESPTKKKNQGEGEKSSLKVPSVTGPVESLSSLVQAGNIQIISPDTDSSRLAQYKCTLEMQPSSIAQVVDPPSVSYTYHTDTSTTSSVAMLKTEDSTQTDNHRSQNHEPMDEGTTTYYVRVPSTVEQSTSPGQSEGSEVVEGETLDQTITFAPNAGQEMLVHFGFNNKDNQDQSNTATIIRTDDRESIAQIGEFLRMKTVVVEEGGLSAMCDQCGKHLDSVEHQANHTLTCPGPSDNKDSGHFPCDICGKPFKRKEHLFQHRKLHTGERPYSCPTCGKAFSRKEHLVRHSVSHTGQKVHACDMCNKSFSRKDNLHKHRKTHGAVGPYICEICGKSFVVKHYYLMHKATHASPDSPDEPLPYRCDVCYKGFSIKQYLITHMLRHNRKPAPNADSTTNGGREQQRDSEPETETETELSTVNAAAILPPNVIHHGNNTGPLFQVTTQLLDNYRRLHASSSS